MEEEVESIFLTNEFSSSSETGDVDTNTDVIVQLKSGKKYIASFFTFENINKIRRQNMVSGENLNGRFFWSKHLILTNACDLENIKEIINCLIEEGDFTEVFGLLNTTPKK